MPPLPMTAPDATDPDDSSSTAMPMPDSAAPETVTPPESTPVPPENVMPEKSGRLRNTALAPLSTIAVPPALVTVSMAVPPDEISSVPPLITVTLTAMPPDATLSSARPAGVMGAVGLAPPLSRISVPPV